MADEHPRELHEPPDDLLKTPRDRIKALLDDPDEVCAAIDELTAAGIERGDIYVMSGTEGAERLDVSGRHKGLKGLLYAFADRFGDVTENRQQSIDHMKAGGFWVSVPADEGDKISVAGILGRHGGHDMVHYGQYHHERIGS